MGGPGASGSYSLNVAVHGPGWWGVWGWEAAGGAAVETTEDGVESSPKRVRETRHASSLNCWSWRLQATRCNTPCCCLFGPGELRFISLVYMNTTPCWPLPQRPFCHCYAAGGPVLAVCRCHLSWRVFLRAVLRCTHVRVSTPRYSYVGLVCACTETASPTASTRSS